MDEQGEPWFVAKDVCKVLGYARSTVDNNLGTLINNVPEQWTYQHRMLVGRQTVKLWCLSEQGLYFFLGRSDKPAALPFQMWAAGEVFPSIRKHGGYLTPSKIEEALLDPDVLIRLATDLKEERAEFLITRDGFTLLAMGYTGSKDRF